MAKDQVLTVFCFFRPTYLNCDRTYHFEYLFVPTYRNALRELQLKLFQSATRSLTFYACYEPSSLNSFLFALNQKEPFVHAVSSAATPVSFVMLICFGCFVSLPPRSLQKVLDLHNRCSRPVTILFCHIGRYYIRLLLSVDSQIVHKKKKSTFFLSLELFCIKST